MPEAWLRVRWPDGAEAEYYSPSSVLASHFAAGDAFETVRFLEVAGAALRAASRRVQARFGTPCARAAVSLRRIEADALMHRDGVIVVLDVALGSAG